MDQLVTVACGTGELEAIESAQIRFVDHLPAEKLLEPVRQIEERHRVHRERLEWKQGCIVRPCHRQIEARRPKDASRLHLAVVAQHRSAAAHAAGHPDIARSGFPGDGQLELPLDPAAPYLHEDVARFGLRDRWHIDISDGLDDGTRYDFYVQLAAPCLR